MKRAAIWILLIATLAVSAGSLLAATLPAGIEILEPERVLLDRTQLGSDGQLYLEDQEGTLRRFVTSTADPLVTNPGSGEFHPLSRRLVEDALLAIDPRFLTDLGFEIYLLPYPVAHPLTSWAGHGAIYLSPGVYALNDRQIHQLVAHEIGHLVHRALLPDDDLESWQAYRNLRGIQDSTLYHALADHQYRPREIFAEDFRVLFGGPFANDGGTIENPSLPRPGDVPGLHLFFLSLIGEEFAAGQTEMERIYPNPLTAGRSLHLFSDGVEAPASIELYDVTGRMVRRIEQISALGGGRFEISFDGRDDTGRALPGGVYYGRIASGAGASRFTLRLLP